MFTTTGFGPRPNKKTAGAYHFLVYMPTAQICHTRRASGAPHAGTPRPVLEQFAYRPGNRIHQPFTFFVLGPNPVVVFRNGVPIQQSEQKYKGLEADCVFLFY